MPRAVRFDEYGGIDVLYVAEVERPRPKPGGAVVRVKAAGINPGEASIREGRLHSRFPATFPSGQGSDLAGVIEEVDDDLDGFAVGDPVVGFSHDRSSHAELVAVDGDKLVPKPEGVPWEAGGALFVAGSTAYAAVRAVGLARGDTVVVSAAAGGVGTLAVQLAVSAGARVIGLASEPHHAWLEAHGVVPMTYGDGVVERIRAAAPEGVDAFLDLFGGGYVDLALKLGVATDRIDTIADFQAAREKGVKAEGSATAATAAVLGELVERIARGDLEVPIAAAYPLEQVHEAYRELSKRHTLGKIVLRP